MKTLTSLKSEPIATLVDAPEYSVIQDKILRLQLAKAEYEQRRQELIDGRTRLQEESRQEEMLARSEAILAGPQEDYSAKIAALSGQSDQLARDIHDLGQAIEFHQKALEGVAQKLSLERCKDLAPQHREYSRAIVFKVLDVVKANRASDAFLDSLRDSGVDPSSLWPMNFHRIGSLQDAVTRNSSLGSFLVEAVEHGFVTDAEIEKALLER